MKNTSENYFNNKWQERVQNPKSWYATALMNEYIANFLLRKYKSYFKRLYSQQEDEIQQGFTGNFTAKKRGLNDRNGDLFRYILMFLGLSIECYLKSYLIKMNKIQIFKDNGLELSQKITNHNLEAFYKEAFLKIDSCDEKVLKNLTRAIKSGKYPVEKQSEYPSYTSDFDNTIKTAKGIIKKIRYNIPNESHGGKAEIYQKEQN